MLKLYFLNYLFLLPFISYCQDDTLAYNKLKKSCDVKEYDKGMWGMYFHTTGTFIKAYSISSSDGMVNFSLAMSKTDTVYTLSLEAYSNTWVSDATGVEGLGSFDKMVSIPDLPITVQYDKYKKKYVYKAKLTATKPFKTDDEKEMAMKIFDLSSCSVYKLYIFTQPIKNHEKYLDCFLGIMDQSLPPEKRSELKVAKVAHDADWASLMKEAKRLDAERAAHNKTKKNTKKKKPANLSKN